MAINKRVSVALTEQEYRLIKWLAERDGVSEQQELKQIFYTELRLLQELYEAEMEQDTQ